MHINHLAAIAAAVATFLLGGLWYSSVLFGKSWMRENGFTEESLKSGSNMARTFGLSFLMALLASYTLAAFVGNQTPVFAIFVSFLTGACWVATAIGTLYLFERRSFTLFMINAGYQIVSFTMMGVILGYWK